MMTTRQLRIVIADDHGVMRDGLRTLVGQQPDMLVVGEVADATHVVPAVLETHPDVVVLDLTMPGGGGLAALAGLRALKEPPFVLILSMHEEASYIARAAAAGADGYVVKQAAGATLIDAIRRVAHGERHFDEATAQQSASPGEPDSRFGEERDARRVTLSLRERQVLQFVARGYTNREAADKLGLSIKTVEGYRARIMRKLRAKSRVDLVRYAAEYGITEDT